MTDALQNQIHALLDAAGPAGVAPLSFADMDKASYIRGMAAFYELGSIDVMEQVFVRGCVQRTIDALVAFVNSGKRPADKWSAAFLKHPGARHL